MGEEGSSQHNVHDAKTNLSRIIERVERGKKLAIKAQTTRSAVKSGRWYAGSWAGDCAW
jgi:hypothetical protein